MQIELNEGMKRCHQENGFLDQFLHRILLHQQQGYFGEVLGIFYHPYPYFFDLFEGPEGNYLVF